MTYTVQAPQDFSGRGGGTSQRPHTTQQLKEQTSVSPVEFEPTIPANERPQTHALDRATTEIAQLLCNWF